MSIDEQTNLDDPVAGLLELDPPKSKFELSPDGYYERWIPSEEEHESLSAWTLQYIRNLEKDNEKILWEIADNIDAYKAKPTRLGNNATEDPVVTLPVIGRKIDHLVSFEVSTLMQARPVVSVDPFFDDSYEVMSSQVVETPFGPQEVGAPKMFDAEQVAATWEFGLDYRLRKRMPFRKILKKLSFDLKVGNYAVMKVVWDAKEQTYRTNRTTRTPEGFVVVDGSEERIIRANDPAKILNINHFAFLAPIDCTLDEAELVCELTPMSSTEVREALSSDQFFLVDRDETTWSELLTKTTDKFRLEQDGRTIQGAKASAIERHDIREVWFEWPVETEEYDEEGKKYTVLKRTSLCGQFHMGARKFLAIYRNPYHHGRFPYVLITEDEDGRRCPETSLVGRMKKNQALASQMLHINVANAIAASNFDIFCDPDSDAWDAFTEQGRAPGRIIPKREGDLVEMMQPGKNHPGLNQEIGFVLEDMTDTSGVHRYNEGAAIPGRTPADSIRQIMQSGLMRPLMTIATTSDGFAEVIKMYLRVLRQFQPYGEVVPTKDPDTREKIMVPFLLPVEEVLDNFDISLTAADEAMAKEADQEQRIMMFNLLRDASGTFAQMAGAMADVNASPALTALFEQLLQSNIRAAQLIIEPVRKDTQKFLPSEEVIQAIVQEKMQNVQLAMQQQQMMGGMPGGGAEGNPGAVPGEAGPGGGMGPMGPPAGNPGAA